MAQKYIKDDIVMYKNRLHTIIDTLALNNYELSYVRHSVNQAELSGVPITPEILEKNGWKREAIHEYIISEIEYFDTKLTRVNLIYSMVSDTYRHYKHSMIYVHQLQHLLFGLGLNSEMEV